MIGGMKLRVARHTDRLEAVTAFYRDRVGFPELGRFVDHDGYDGVFLAVPGTGAHLELTSEGSHRASPPHPESLLVLYLETQAEIDAIATRIARTCIHTDLNRGHPRQIRPPASRTADSAAFAEASDGSGRTTVAKLLPRPAAASWLAGLGSGRRVLFVSRSELATSWLVCD
jgi:YycE-like N-terminal domain